MNPQMGTPSPLRKIGKTKDRLRVLEDIQRRKEDPNALNINVTAKNLDRINTLLEKVFL